MSSVRCGVTVCVGGGGGGEVCYTYMYVHEVKAKSYIHEIVQV